MDYGHTAQNGQIAPQFGNPVNPTDGRVNNLMPNTSVQAAQNFGANAMGAYQSNQIQGVQPAMPQISQVEQLQMMPGMAEQQMMYGQQVGQVNQAPQMDQIQTVQPQVMPVEAPQMNAPQMNAPQMSAPQVGVTQPVQAPAENVIESLKHGVDLKNGLSASDVTKMDSAIQLVDKMGPHEFYEQFSTVSEVTVGNNYGLGDKRAA